MSAAIDRPFIWMLVAVSLDGKIAPKRKPGRPNPVGPSLIGADIMELHNSQRAKADGIMVGRNCILLDDSRLTLRKKGSSNPTRIVLDGLAEIPPAARVFGGEARTIVAITPDAPSDRVAAFRGRGADIVTGGRGRFVDLPHLVHELHSRFGIRQLLVEGGGTVHRSMIAAQLYDEIHLIVCPFVIGGSTSVTPVERKSFWPHERIPRYQLGSAEVLGDYLYVRYRTLDASGEDAASEKDEAS